MEGGISLNCKNCGGKIIDTGNGIYKCQYCGSVILIPNKNRDFITIAGKLEAYTGASQKIIIPQGTLIIGQGAFKDCVAIESIILPDSITRIESEAFAGCMNLKEIILPKSLKFIGQKAFKESGLISITLYEQIEQIGSEAFMLCPFLKQVSFYGKAPKGSEKIFKQCSQLSNVEINLSEFSPSFKSSMEAYKKGDPRPTFFDFFQGTPFFAELQRSYMSNTCVICGGQIDKKRTCKNCKTTYYDKRQGCYVATCIYGSYNCPEVWVLRRYRDNTLCSTWYGRLFIRMYYAISPALVKWFGHTKWFKKLWKGKLDRMVAKLLSNGVKDTPYEDKQW